MAADFAPPAGTIRRSAQKADGASALRRLRPVTRAGSDSGVEVRIHHIVRRDRRTIVRRESRLTKERTVVTGWLSCSTSVQAEERQPTASNAPLARFLR